MWQEKTTNSYLQHREQIDAVDQLSCLLIYNTMSSQDFISTPKENYVEQQPKSSEVLLNPTISEEAKQLTLLQRQKPTMRKEDNSSLSQVAENQLDIVEERVLKSLPILKPGQLEKTKPILKKTTKPRM